MKLKITVHGVAYEVDVEVLDPGEGFLAPARSHPAHRRQGAGSAPAPAPSRKPQTTTSAAGGAVTSPIAGTVVEIKCKPGDAVANGQELLIIEAMKMNTTIAAPTDGKVKAVPVAAGDSVREGQVLVELA